MFKTIVLIVFFLFSFQVDAHALSFQKALTLKQAHPILLIARKKSQFVLIEFNTENCRSCDDLKKHTFSDANVETALADYGLIEVSLTPHNKQSFKQRFNVQQTPTLVFLDKGGQFLPEFTITGFVSPPQLLNVIARVEKANEN